MSQQLLSIGMNFLPKMQVNVILLGSFVSTKQ